MLLDMRRKEVLKYLRHFSHPPSWSFMSVSVCVCVRARARVLVCVCVRARAFLCVCVCVCAGEFLWSTLKLVSLGAFPFPQIILHHHRHQEHSTCFEIWTARWVERSTGIQKTVGLKSDHVTIPKQYIFHCRSHPTLWTQRQNWFFFTTQCFLARHEIELQKATEIKRNFSYLSIFIFMFFLRSFYSEKFYFLRKCLDRHSII